MTKHEQLSNSDINRIKSLCLKKLCEYGLVEDIIGTQVFTILEKESRVLYYPLEDDEVWGFSEMKNGNAFVCINTSLAYDKQVFAAAHELYHLWYDNASEVILSGNMISENDLINQSEAAANRFAAEFLVNEGLLLRQIDIYISNRKQLDIKDVLRLANQFLVPYKTMVRRLNEIGVLKDSSCNELLSKGEQVEIWRKRLGLSLPMRENRIGLHTLVDLSMDLYEKDLITYEKLEYLLGFAQIKPKDVGIEHINDYVPPDDSELEAILEE